MISFILEVTNPCPNRTPKPKSKFETEPEIKSKTKVEIKPNSKAKSNLEPSDRKTKHKSKSTITKSKHKPNKYYKTKKSKKKFDCKRLTMKGYCLKYLSHMNNKWCPKSCKSSSKPKQCKDTGTKNHHRRGCQVYFFEYLIVTKIMRSSEPWNCNFLAISGITPIFFRDGPKMVIVHKAGGHPGWKNTVKSLVGIAIKFKKKTIYLFI